MVQRSWSGPEARFRLDTLNFLEMGTMPITRATSIILCLVALRLGAQTTPPSASMTIQTEAGSQPVRWQATYTTIYSEDAAKIALTLGPGLQLQNGASIVTDPALMLPGTASIRLKNYGAVTTMSAII